MNLGREEERVRCMQRVTWNYIAIYKVESQCEFAIRLRKQTGALYQPRGV